MRELREFGKFRLDTKKKVLWHEDKPIDLPLKSIEVLSVLTETGELVTKDEILTFVWRDVYVEESNLTSHIYRLRKMFAKYGESDAIIQTVPKRGYRFIGEVVYLSDSPEIAVEQQPVTRTLIEELPGEPDQKLKALRIRSSKNRWRSAVIAGVSFALIVLGYYAVTSQQSEEIRSIAVLPLKSFDGKVNDENLSIRIMDSMITKLSRLDLISVRPTSSTIKLVNSGESAVEIGRKLAVDAILEGLIQRENNQIRVTVQLVSVKTTKQIWSQQFDGEADKLLDLQNTVSAQLLDELHLRLTKEQQTNFSRRPTDNSEAYEEYLIGRHFWQKRTRESLKSAITAFEKAISLDPNFADAYVGLADSHYLVFDYSYDTSPKNVELAREYLGKAIELNPKLSDAYTTLGLLQTTYEWNWHEAENSFLKARELGPNSPNVHHRYGMFLAKLRRFDEAEAELTKAKELDPTSASINMNIGVVLMNAKKTDAAVKQLQKTLELDSNFLSPRWYLARCYWQKGEKRLSIMESAKAMELGGEKELAAKLIRELDILGESETIKNWANEWKSQIGPQGVNAHSMAVLGFYQNNKEETLNWLEKSVAVHHPWATWINAEPEFDFVREEPRFQLILRKINLKQ